MGYDPVRDSAMRSPEDVRRQTSQLGSAYMTPDDRTNPEASSSSGLRNYPPAFHQSPPGSSSIVRSMSGGLRDLLHDESVDPRRRSSDRSSYGESATSNNSHQPPYDHARPSPNSASRPSIHSLLNATPSAPVMSLSSSDSTHRTNSPIQSPGSRQYNLPEQGTYLTPASTRNRHSTSPLVAVSPSRPHVLLPSYETIPSHEVHAGPSEPRISPNRAPQQTPGSSSGQKSTPAYIPRQSPSASASPYTLNQPLQISRPNSSTSSSHPFAYQPPHSSQSTSPPRISRHLSEDHSRKNSLEAPSLDRRGSMPPRKASHTSNYSPSRPAIRSPSPIVPLTPYEPRRITEPSSVLLPITTDELAHLKSMAMRNNRLRTRLRRPPPSWSAPSPSHRQPTDGDNSYFPPQRHDRGRSMSSVGRASVTPGPGAHAASHDMKAQTPSTNGNPGRRNTENMRERNQLKRTGSVMAEAHDTNRRKVSDTAYVGNAVQVADHYNSRPEVGVQGREFSPIIGLKKFNNWIKSVLIGKFAYRASGAPGARVLDIGCGKGGDLNKWRQARISLYVGMDLAATSVDQARERWQRMNKSFDAAFFAHDCYSNPISDVLPPNIAIKDFYDNVSLQFCMHYAFESASKARMMIENVSRYLRKGGTFIGTIPDANVLLERLNELPEDAEELRFGNPCYSIEFSERKHKGIYGHQYRFYLEDAVEDVPEYLVNWDNFESLASEYRLRVVYKKSFNEILQEEQSSRDFGPLLGRMGVINAAGESAMDAAQWEAANLYMAFAFEKY